MASIRESLYIIYNGINSQDLGIINCNVSSSGLMDEPLNGARSIVETKVSGRKQNYFHGFDYEPLSFQIQLAFENGFTSDQLREAMRWLYVTDFYSSLAFSDKPDQVCYALIVDEPRLVHSNGQGYIQVSLVTDSPHFFGSVVSETTDLTTNPSGTNVTIENSGDLGEIPTVIIITKVGAGNITITNLTNSDATTLEGVEDKQVILINGEQEDIQSAPRGILTFSGVTSNTETVTIGDHVYEFSTDGIVGAGRVEVDISGGASASQSVTALVATINLDVGADFSAVDGAGNTVIIYMNSVEVDGDDIATTETCANASWGDTVLTNIYPYSLWNGECITLAVGTNILFVDGTCIITVLHQSQLLAGE